MKKIMFNDRYGLTTAVLEGRKTMTRRVINAPRTMEGKDVYGYSVVKYPRTGVPIEVMALDADGAQINNIMPKFKVGEVVAVAQSYKDVMEARGESGVSHLVAKAGYKNKMFVRAELMPHQIRITGVRMERLQDISDEDCLREGIYNWKDAPDCPSGQKNCPIELYAHDGSWDGFLSPRDAFAALIDKVSGKGTWESNPWVFVYGFELVKED
jgi:hypothetical protein